MHSPGGAFLFVPLPRMGKVSTNALTARYCKSKGWPCATVQTFYGGRRHDLFGIADSIILHPSWETWVQNCSYGSLKAHRDQIDSINVLPLVTALVELWEWRRKKVGRKKLWFLRRQARTLTEWGPISKWEGPLDL